MGLFKTRIVSKLALSPTAPEPEREGLAIVAIVKNEERYVEEWARFHLAAGVRQFFIYDNGSTDGTVEAIEGALPGEALMVTPWAQRVFDARSGAEVHSQVLAYTHALANFGSRFRWMAFIDVDEFIVPMDGGLITEALVELGEAAHVSLPWHMFGRAGHQEMPEGGVLENYLERMAHPQRAKHALNWKCIVDPSLVTAVRVHSMEVDGKSEGINDVGIFAPHSKRGDASFYSNARLQLNHYYTRSNAELEAKIARGSVKLVDARQRRRRMMRILDEIEAEAVEDRVALDYWKARKPG